jgi:putative redox protein
MVTVNWVGGMAFEADPPSGNKFVMDSHVDFGGENRGPTPLEAFLASAAACSAVDVLAILKKKQQKVTGYRVEVDGERTPEGQYPRPYTSLVVRHIVQGEGIDPRAVERAVELSDEKYCTVMATLRHAPAISSEYRIEETGS